MKVVIRRFKGEGQRGPKVRVKRGNKRFKGKVKRGSDQIFTYPTVTILYPSIVYQTHTLPVPQHRPTNTPTPVSDNLYRIKCVVASHIYLRVCAPRTQGIAKRIFCYIGNLATDKK
jgi:hypothetical protein